MRVKRGLVLVPVVLALALFAAACGSQSVVQRDAVAAAAAKTSDAGLACRLRGDCDPVRPRRLRPRPGRLRLRGRRGRLELEASSLLAGSRLEVRIVDSRVFVRVPTALAWIPGAKPWVAVGDKSLDAYGLGELQQDPGQLLSLLRASSAKVTKTGTVDVRGVATTRYVAQLELTKASKRTPLPSA